MSLFDFFFPDQAQASHLRDIARSQRLQASRTHARAGRDPEMSDLKDQLASAHREIDELRDELGEAALVIEALIEKLELATVITREELAALAREVDARDGVVDGKITKEEPVDDNDPGLKLKFSSNRKWPGEK